MKLFRHTLKIVLVAFVASYCVDYLRAFRLGVALESELVAAAANPVTRAPRGSTIGAASSRVRKSLQEVESEWRSRGLRLHTSVQTVEGEVIVSGHTELETWVFRYLGQPTMPVSRKRTYRFETP